jgi:hypothetical protein
MTDMAPRIVQVIPQLSLGGTGLALIAAAKYSSRLADFAHMVAGAPTMQVEIGARL